jgi:hypothetical protein
VLNDDDDDTYHEMEEASIGAPGGAHGRQPKPGEPIIFERKAIEPDALGDDNNGNGNGGIDDDGDSDEEVDLRRPAGAKEKARDRAEAAARQKRAKAQAAAAGKKLVVKKGWDTPPCCIRACRWSACVMTLLVLMSVLLTSYLWPVMPDYNVVWHACALNYGTACLLTINNK